MATHDPLKVVGVLRDHLATHDTPLAFLFGAGTSSCVNVAPKAEEGEQQRYEPLIPGVDALTVLCRAAVEAIGAEFKAAWAVVQTEVEEARGLYNVETVLSRVRAKLDAMGGQDTPLGLDRDSLAKLERTLRSTICQQAIPAEGRIPVVLPHDTFAQWVRHVQRKRPIELFTTNYDVLIERSLEYAQVPAFDGFVGCYEPFFDPESVMQAGTMPGGEWVRLWKIHGSVNWRRTDAAGRARVIRTQPCLEGEMILPSHWKYDESRKLPYRALLDRLGRVLNVDGAILVSCGYSFRDDHINEALLTALDKRPLAHVFALQYEDVDPTDGVVRLSSSRANMHVLARNGAVIAGRWGEWRMLEPLDKRTTTYMEIPFSVAPAQSEGEPALGGEFRLGDFNAFCRFLIQMARPGSLTA